MQQQTFAKGHSSFIKVPFPHFIYTQNSCRYSFD
jgi:hypothetical protein